MIEFLYCTFMTLMRKVNVERVMVKSTENRSSKFLWHRLFIKANVLIIDTKPKITCFERDLCNISNLRCNKCKKTSKH